MSRKYVQVFIRGLRLAKPVPLVEDEDPGSDEFLGSGSSKSVRAYVFL